MRDVVIVEAVRTPVGRTGGALKELECDRLATIPIRECMRRVGIPPEMIDEAIMGQAKLTTDIANFARVATLRSGISMEIPAYTVMRQCGSGLEAVNSAARQIVSGISDTVSAGGVESMSTAPFYLRRARYGYVAGNDVLVDSITESQPRSQFEDIFGRIESMGLTAENLAEKYSISRQEQDEFAVGSQQKAVMAI